MMLHLHLTTNDVQALANCLEMNSKNVLPYLKKMLSEWNNEVELVERTYPLTIYDYQNGLSIREILYQIERCLSPDGNAQLQKVLNPIDKRFKLATFVLERPVFKKPKKSFWWYFRVPKQMGDELREDLRKEGLLKN